LASFNPARMLGLADRNGAITPGLDGDLIVLDEDLGACPTIVAGGWVHGARVGVYGLWSRGLWGGRGNARYVVAGATSSASASSGVLLP
jgi:Amidohydrolase family